MQKWLLFARLFIDITPLERMAFHRGGEKQNKKVALYVLIQQINVNKAAKCIKR